MTKELLQQALNKAKASAIEVFTYENGIAQSAHDAIEYMHSWLGVYFEKQALAQQEQPESWTRHPNPVHHIGPLSEEHLRDVVERTKAMQVALDAWVAQAQSGQTEVPCPLAFVEQTAQKPDTWKTQFLTDVMTSAGLLMYGRTDKKLAQRIADGSARWRTELYASAPTQPAQGPCGCREGECETKKDKSCRMTLEIAERDGIPEWTQEQPASVDAYVGAREDAAIWKKRALEAEELNRKFIAELNGPTYLGEPAQPAQEPFAIVPRTMILEDADLRFLHGLSQPDDEDGSFSPIALTVGDGHAGHGLYASLSEYPEEGADIICKFAPPTQPSPSDDEILNCFYASKSEGMVSYMLAVGRAIEAHCRGGANK